MVPFLRLDFSPVFLFFSGSQATSHSDSKEPGPCCLSTHTWTGNGQRELLVNSHFVGSNCSDVLTPPPSCSTAVSEGNEATVRTKRAVKRFVRCPLPPSSKSSPQRAAPLQLGSGVTSLPAPGRNDEQGLCLQTSDTQKPQASVSTRSAQGSKSEQWHCHWKNSSTPLTSGPSPGSWRSSQASILKVGKHLPIPWLAQKCL